MTRHLKLIIILALAGVLASGSAAEAAFPGANGRIGYVQQEIDPSAEDDYPRTDLEVFVMQPDGSQAEQLTTNDVGEAMAEWSADGRLAVHRQDDIYVLNEDGRDSHALGVGAKAYWPTWSPDGRRIAYIRYNRLFIKNSDGTGEPRRVGRFRAMQPTWSPSGHRIAFTGLCVRCSYYRRIVGLFTVRPDGSNLKKLTDRWDYQVDWAPDGRKVVFLREQRGGSGDGENSLMKARADGTRVKELIGILEGAEVLSTPVWSPDGTKIAFQGCSFIGDDGCDIFTMDPIGRNRRKIASTPTLYYGFYGITWEALPPES